MRVLPLLAIIAAIAVPGCKAFEDREQFAFLTAQLEEEPEPPLVVVAPRPGAFLITGVFPSCVQSNLKPTVSRSGSTLRIVVRETGCQDGTATAALISYQLSWWGLGFEQLYTVRIEHEGQLGSADGIVLEQSARTD